MRRGEITQQDIELGALGARWSIFALATGILGWIATGLVASAVEHGMERFYQSYLVNFMFFLGLGLGALFFVLVTHLTRAGWSVALRRITEVGSLTLLPLFLFALVIFVGRHELYEWTHLDVVAADELLQHKQGYLNSTFFLARLVFYFVVWGGLALYFYRRSVMQDGTRNPAVTLQMERVSAPGTILYALTVTFAAFDLLMSLYPHWYSTIYGVYYFSGSVLATFALVTLLVALFQRAGRLSDVVTTEHFHDLGKLIFAFVVFWAYVAFSQYMLIWIATIPEETVWYELRSARPWADVSLVLLFGHFLVPFLWLMSRHVKRRRPALLLAAVWLLAMHWLDLYWLVMPEKSPDHLPFHLLDLTILVGFAGVFFFVVFRMLARGNLVPLGDPRLDESMGLENV